MSELPPVGELVAGRYEVTGVLGSGGSGTVLEVRDGQQLRALKLYHRTDAGMLKRFHAEREALLALDHPGVVVALDSGLYKDRPFLVMRRLRGQPLTPLRRSLPAWVEGPPHPALVDAARPMLRLLAVLSDIHQRGWVHRDLSPGNVFVEPSGAVRLLDLGLATPTGEGQRWGTPGWVAPEQALGRRVDARADLYSCGVMLYYLLTGHVPWGHERGRQLLLRQLIGDVDPPGVRTPAVPKGLERLVLRMLSLSPADRPSSAAEARVELEQQLGLGDRRPAAPSRARLPLLGRVRELNRLEELLAAALAGEQITPVLITGGAGIGKTRLLEELVSRATLQGVAVRRGADAGGRLTGPTVVAEAMSEQQVAPPAPGILHVATARAPAEDRDIELLTLSPLTPQELNPLCPGAGGVRAAQALHQASGGTPLLLVDVWSQWTRAGQLRRSPAGWSFGDSDPAQLPAPALPQSFSVWVQSRLQGADGDGQRVLEALAVLGGASRRAQLRATEAIAPASWRAAEARLLDLGLLLRGDQPDRVRLFHPRAAEVLSASTRASTARRWLCRSLDHAPPTDLLELERLLERSGRIHQAARLSLQRAQKLESEQKHKLAAQGYARAATALAGEERQLALQGAQRCQDAHSTG